MTTVKYDLERLKKTFDRFADMECKGKSALYYRLSKKIAEDQVLLGICRECRERQPVPNLLLGAIHYLLLQSKDEELALYYPSISGQRVEEIPYPLFREFCLRKEDAIQAILKSRIVQTNAVNRTSYLMPIISSFYEGVDDLTVIDIGASSGLNLNYDKYAYAYTNGITIGEGGVKVKSEVRGDKFPMFDSIIPAKNKIGIDQNILDVRKEDNALWLKALIWPDLVDRFALIESAIEEFKNANNIGLVNASSLAAFEKVILSTPEKESLFIYHTHVLYQFTKEERARFRSMMDRVGSSRDFGYLAVEGGSVFDTNYDMGEVLIELTEYKKGKKKKHLLAKVDAHGRWMEWK